MRVHGASLTCIPAFPCAAVQWLVKVLSEQAAAAPAGAPLGFGITTTPGLGALVTLTK